MVLIHLIKIFTKLFCARTRTKSSMHADFLRCYFRCANVCFSTVLYVRRRKRLFIRRNCSLNPKFIEEGPGEKQKAFKLLRIAQNVLAGCDGFFLSAATGISFKQKALNDDTEKLISTSSQSVKLYKSAPIKHQSVKQPICSLLLLFTHSVERPPRSLFSYLAFYR